MAEKAKARHAHGSRQNLEAAIQAGKVDSFDVLFLSGENETPAMGWITKDGKPIIIEQTDLSGINAELSSKANITDVTQLESELAKKAGTEEVSQLETELATKASAEEVNTKFGKIETALDDVTNATHTHEKVKYEIADVPTGTLVKINDGEIRVMCPKDATFTKQAVGAGGNPNDYYMTFKTYVYNDNIVGYKEHLGEQVDAEILTDLKTDEYGRRYQPTWLGVAKYDEETDTWTYYGASSSVDKYIGWDYQIDWFDANGVMVASDSVRINLSNEDCHYAIKPYYGVSTTEEIETKVEEVVVTRVEEVVITKVEEVVVTKVEEVVEEKVTTKVEEAVENANSYTDAKIAELEEASSYKIVEF